VPILGDTIMPMVVFIHLVGHLRWSKLPENSI